MQDTPNTEEIQQHLQQRDTRFAEALNALKSRSLDDAVAIATAFRRQAIALIGTEVEMVRIARLENAGSAAQQIMTALPEELLLDSKPPSDMHTLRSIYMSRMATGKVNTTHEERILLPFASSAELMRVVLNQRRAENGEPDSPPAIELPSVE